ncbi:pentapeptide repeat-containing protein [Desulfotalea psychrophila]|nr:pentapeptide repeat-containing protein [Desulfotalea psychrophila]
MKAINRWKALAGICIFAVCSGASSCFAQGDTAIEQLLQTKACPGCDLAGVDLTRAELAGANLEGADLSQTKFFLADLSGANLRNCNLQGAIFGGADLGDADLTGASLAGANFSGAYTAGLVFPGDFNLAVAVEQESAEAGSEVAVQSSPPIATTSQPLAVAASDAVALKDSAPETEGRSVQVGEEAVVPVIVAGQKSVELGKAVQSNSVAEVTVTPAPAAQPAPVPEPLREGRTVQVDAIAAPIAVVATGAAVVADGAEATPVQSSGTSFVEEDMVSTKEPVLQVTDSVVVETLASEEVARNFIEKVVEAGECYQCDLAGLDFSGESLTGADLEQADLSGANLAEADLADANLRGANLRGANLTGADLRRADLYKGDLRGADLTGANLEDTQMDGVLQTDAVGVTAPSFMLQN